MWTGLFPTGWSSETSGGLKPAARNRNKKSLTVAYSGSHDSFVAVYWNDGATVPGAMRSSHAWEEFMQPYRMSETPDVRKRGRLKDKNVLYSPNHLPRMYRPRPKNGL